MIKTASIYASPVKDGGLRVLVTRYWPRGVKKTAVDAWFQGLGPEVPLIKAWKAGQITWAKFEARYLDEYRDAEKARLLTELEELIKGQKGGAVTLLCTCREGEPCHRLILKSMLETRGRIKLKRPQRRPLK